MTESAAIGTMGDSVVIPGQRPEHPLDRIVRLAANPDVAYFDSHNRDRVDAPPAWMVDRLIPVGCTVLVAPPGHGKSMLVQQLLHHCCYGTPLGSWDDGGLGKAIAVVVDLEGDSHLNRERGWGITPSLPQDGTEDRTDKYITYLHQVIGRDDPDHERFYGGYKSRIEAQIRYLEHVLSQAKQAGRAIDFLVIDTLKRFMGPTPAGANAYDWEAEVVGMLNKAAHDYGMSIIVLHHTNKAGEVSGSTGIAGSSSCTMKLEMAEPVEGEARTGRLYADGSGGTKVRNDGGFSYAVIQESVYGLIEFDNSISSEHAVSAGNRKRVLDHLAQHGPSTKRELMATGLANSLKTTLHRLKREGLIRSLGYGQYALPIAGEHHPVPGGYVPAETCGSCGERLQKTSPEQEYHPNIECDPDHDKPADEAPGKWSGSKALVESVKAVAGHKTWVVPRARRSEAPFNLVHEGMNGHFNWRRTDLDADARIWCGDRYAAYFAAAADVPVSRAVPVHTGPDVDRKGRAGIYRVDPGSFTWGPAPVENGIGSEQLPHPLGRSAITLDGELWLADSHLSLLQRLAADPTSGLSGNPVILDSWTGPSVRNLFKQFSEEVALEKELAKAAGDDVHTAFKVRASQAIRGLFPVAAKAWSPTYRPDWYIAILAEHGVRHWRGAQKATAAGAVVVGMHTTDCVDFLMPAGAGDDWTPPGVLIGHKYGHIKNDGGIASLTEWADL